MAIRQFTWLLDKNKKEIFEWDIVKMLNSDWCNKDKNDKRTQKEYLNSIAYTYIVEFHQWTFYWIYKWEHKNYLNKYWPFWYIEIIWNIYENKNLINQKIS